MDLETGNAGYGTVRSTNLCRIVREGGNLVTVQCRSICKQGTGQLHTISGVSGKTDYDIIGVNNFVLHN